MNKEEAIRLAKEDLNRGVNEVLGPGAAANKGQIPPQSLVIDLVMSNGESLSFAIHGPISPQAYSVIKMVVEWAQQFNRKNQDYVNSGGHVADNFGVLGQYMKLYDKVHKLRKPLWDDRISAGGNGASELSKGLNYERTEEILDDLIGHAFLTKWYLSGMD